ncbi:MAG TPA: radical SAM/SPASM domain-containing protein [Thermoguttaceae bacterium]|nr:radical SAM/SPASM domain-containing protein [Thermoguttaceae bacterium]
MLARLAYRLATEVSPRLLFKAARLWVAPSGRAMRAYRRRVARGELFPPFLFFALTNACNLRCRGCWIAGGGATDRLGHEEVDAMIDSGRRQRVRFHTLLGGEPMLYPDALDIPARHADCYFQIITNGTFFDESNVERIAALGNVTPLVSLDGPATTNDARRGPGVFAAVAAGLRRLQRRKILFGVATTVTGRNLDEVTSDDYVQDLIARGAMYLWYYVFRPVGADPSPELCVGREQMVQLRRRLLELRRRHPILIIDTYWDAEGRAVCPAALGLGFHIGPRGSIEPCPPLSVACETIRDHDGDLFATIDGSTFLRAFQRFAQERTRGCVILEHPRELAEFFREQGATDYSGRDLPAELAASEPRTSHHLPGEEMPEDFWFYRLLKRQLFFGMGGYG